MEKLQKHAWATNRSTCETSALDRELVINTGTADSNGPEAIVVVSGSPYRFPTKNQLATSAGMSLIGLSTSALNNITGSNGQVIIDSIDNVLTDVLADIIAISGSTPSGVILANGSVAYTSNQSMGGYSITNTSGILSNGGLIFGIDEDNNDSNNNFIWRNNGSLELMRLTDSGILGIGTNSPDVSAKLDVNGMVKGTSLLLPHADTPSSFIDGLIWTDIYGMYSRIDGVTTRLNVLTLSDVSSESLNTANQTFSIKSGTEFRIQDNISETPRILFNISESLISLSENTNINGDVTVNGGSVSISSNSDLNLLSTNSDIYLKALEPSSNIYLQASSSVVIDGKLELDASTTSKAPLNIPQGAIPASLNDGDTWLTSAGSYQRINGSTRKLDVMSLSDVSTQSTVTSAQTFTIKNGTSLIFEDYNNITLFNLSANNFDMEINGPVSIQGNSVDIFAVTGDVLLQASGAVSLTTIMKLNSHILYFSGDESTDGSWRRRPSGADLIDEVRIAGVWTQKAILTNP